MNPVLESIRPVVEKSKYVRINKDKIREFAKDFRGVLRHWMAKSPIDLSELGDNQKLNFLFIFNSISFSYWGEPKWTVEYQGKEYDGTWGMIVSLKRAIEQRKSILDSAHLANIEQGELEEILRGNVDIPLFEERWKMLRELGVIVDQEYDGNFGNVIEKAKNDAIGLLHTIINSFPSFNDSTIYGGERVQFHKRAQLLVSDIYQTFAGEGYGNLRNTEELTACADYKIPQVLRKMGILEYDKKLARKVDSKMEIPKGSEEEIEIRAHTIFAVELMKKEMKGRLPNITSSEINDFLWLAGQIKSPGDKPYHRTRTTAY